MSFDPKAIQQLADAYTAAWNSGSPRGRGRISASEDGEMVINHGTPWRGRAGIAM